MIVAEASYELTDPTIDSQIVRLKAAGADLLYDASTPKFAAQAIKKVADLGWKPVHILDINASPVSATLKPAGLDISKDIISTNYGKDPGDPQWKDDPASRPISPSWTSITRKATSSTPSTPTVIRRRNCWCRSCGNAATISRAKTS
jgi:hypothetical protein